MPNSGAEDYLAEAQRAERCAANAQSEIAKNTWLAIAKEYRSLAAEKLRAMQERRGQGPGK